MDINGGEGVNAGYEIYRRRAKLTQEYVAEQLDVTQGAVSQWENGVANPLADMLPKISALYGCTVDELLQSTGNQQVRA